MNMMMHFIAHADYFMLVSFQVVNCTCKEHLVFIVKKSVADFMRRMDSTNDAILLSETIGIFT